MRLVKRQKIARQSLDNFLRLGQKVLTGLVGGVRHWSLHWLIRFVAVLPLPAARK